MIQLLVVGNELEKIVKLPNRDNLTPTIAKGIFKTLRLNPDERFSVIHMDDTSDDLIVFSAFEVWEDDGKVKARNIS